MSVEKVTAAKMSTTTKTCIIPVLVVQCVAVEMFGSGERLSTTWMAASKFLLDAI